MSDKKRLGEFELIERFFAPLSGEGAFGLKDDAALLKVTPGKALVVTQDAIAEPIHFLPGNPPDTIAKKALRVNLSDLAAKGAVPTGFSLALGLGEEWREDWLEAFARGLAEDCRQYGLKLNGGDTFRTGGGPVVSITAWGEIDPDHYRSRLTAQTGDRLFVTGTIGEGALGLLAHAGKLPSLSPETGAAMERRYFVPEPPVAFAPLIAEFASSSMDISDGFIGDLEKLAAASGFDAEIAAGDIPLSPEVREILSGADIPAEKALETALTGGDDYQLLFTVPESHVASFLEKAQKTEFAVTSLGTVRQGDGKVVILGDNRVPLGFASTSWHHF
ncbi:MAG: thiamine-phosphate kinase [Salaquimonas sp.]|nr:thiamine-phosphate kinase [Salaquimonas sp.]